MRRFKSKILPLDFQVRPYTSICKVTDYKLSFIICTIHNEEAIIKLNDCNNSITWHDEIPVIINKGKADVSETKSAIKRIDCAIDELSKFKSFLESEISLIKSLPVPEVKTKKRKNTLKKPAADLDQLPIHKPYPVNTLTGSQA